MSGFTDETWGDSLPTETVEALSHIPLAAVRRAFQRTPHILCPHPAGRLQPYNARFDLCLDCGQMVEH